MTHWAHGIRIVTCSRHTGEHLEQTDCLAVVTMGRIRA